jgi:AraC-like DNA-binding protein
MHLIRTGALTGYTTLVSKLGHNPVLLLHQVGLTPGQLRNPNTYISYQKMADLLDITAEQCHDSLFGLRLASNHSAMVIGELAYGIGMQPTLGDSLRYASTHLALHAQGAHLEEQVLGEQTRWCFYLDFTNDWGLRQLIQLSIGHLSIGLLNDNAPNRQVSIHLKQAEPTNYEKVSGYQKLLVFNSDFDGVQFPTIFSNQKVSQDPDILRDYFQQRIQMLEQLYPNSLPSQLKYLFTSALESGECNLPQVAASLNLHPRVLQKKLHAEGTSFSKLLQQTREDIACQHLRESNIGITDLALKLGYAEVSIFSRYFKRWTGLSPQQWRRQHTNRDD